MEADQTFEEKFESQWRRNAEADGVATQEIEAEVGQIRMLMQSSGEFFINFFLADSLDLPFPQFHDDIWGLLTDQDKERILLAIPRDHAKTTLAKLVVIWYWLFTSHRFCVYLSNTAPIAKGACRDIMGFLEHENFVAVFGRIKMIKSSENEGLWIFDLPRAGQPPKRCMLRGLGQGQQMRGINIDNQRPDIAVVDDVEDNDNTDSPQQQKKLDKWMFGPFLKALARKKKILWLGNMLAKTSLLARLSRNPRWNPVVFGCLVKDSKTGQLQPLWPGKWTVEALKEDFQEYKDNGLVETWMCEMMNMPGHGLNGFTAEQINYAPCPSPDDIRASWITIDPAFGLSKHNDETAICVHVLPRFGVPTTVACVHGHFDEETMYREALSLAECWNAWTWGIEAVAAQKVLITLFQVYGVLNGIRGGIEFIPLQAGRGSPKMARMRAFVNLMAKQQWALADGDLDVSAQILSLDLTKEDQSDDLVDSAAYGPMMADQYMPLIENQMNRDAVDETYVLQQGIEVTCV